MNNSTWQKLLEQSPAANGMKGNDLLNKLMNSGVGGGLLGGLVGGGLAGMLGNKKTLNSALKIGGIAAIGGLAYAAYNRYRQQQPEGHNEPREIEIPPQGGAFLPPANDSAAQNAMGLALIRAMIAAAKADGHIDDAERQRISGQIGGLELSAEEKAFLFDEIAKPLDIDAVVSLGTSPEIASELYTASLLAITPDHPAEKAYLQMLAARLGLNQALIEQIHRAVAAA